MQLNKSCTLVFILNAVFAEKLCDSVRPPPARLGQDALSSLYLAENKRVSGALRLPQCPAQLTTYETQPSFSVAAGALSFTDSRID